MAINSMTGFARREGALDDWKWIWEARSVNGKGLDVRFRVPSAFSTDDAALKRQVQAAFARGNINVTLNLERDRKESHLSVNVDWLAELARQAHAVAAETGGGAVDVSALMAVRGVVDVADPEDDDGATEARDALISADFCELLVDLARARAEEGARLAGITSDLVAEIEQQIAAASTTDAARPDQRRLRMETALRELLDLDPPVTEDRLAQELAILATRGDIREEIDRLIAHVAQARDLAASEEPVGRRLDFLAQEFNREANTLCSKSGDVALTRIGMAMKATIDRLREQVQNVE
ncbi:MAG: YicC family protein [Minwuia sp.]|nr:YicC family protein [Minwuia sp.]